MFCPSCGAKNVGGARVCVDCKRPLPGVGAGAGPSGAASSTVPTFPAIQSTQLDDQTATVPEAPAQPSPEPPRILRKPAPLAPASLDVVPRNPSPSGSSAPPAPAPVPAQFRATRAPVDAEDPTLVRGKRPERPATAPPPPAAPPSHAPSAAPHVAPPVAPRAATTAPVGAKVLHDDVTVPLPAMNEAMLPKPPPREPVREAKPALRPEPKSEPRTEPAPAPRAEPRRPQPAVSDAARQAPTKDPPLRLQVASGARWAAASLIDLVVTAGVMASATVGALASQGVRAAPQPVVDYIYASPTTAVMLLVGAPLAAVFVMHGLVVALAGGTLGQRALGLRVVRGATGARVGIPRALVRGLASAVGTMLVGVGPLWGVLLDRRRRGLGDLLARTIVVRAPAPGATPNVAPSQAGEKR